MLSTHDIENIYQSTGLRSDAIKSVSFPLAPPRAKVAYDAERIDAWIAGMADEADRVWNLLREMASKTSEIEAKQAEIEAKQAEIAEALISANKVAKTIIDEAQHDARKIRAEASETLEQARQSVKEITDQASREMEEARAEATQLVEQARRSAEELKEETKRECDALLEEATATRQAEEARIRATTTKALDQLVTIQKNILALGDEITKTVNEVRTVNEVNNLTEVTVPQTSDPFPLQVSNNTNQHA